MQFTSVLDKEKQQIFTYDNQETFKCLVLWFLFDFLWLD